MNFPRKLRLRFRALFGKSNLDAEMDDEMRSHIELRTQQNVEAGMLPEEARFAALRQFGWTESIKETCREQRGVLWLENLAQDLRYGARQLRKNPGFTTVAVLTLALGIGANTAIFSLVNGILLRSLPVPNPEELRVIEWSGTDVHHTRNSGNRSSDGAGRVKQDAFSYPLFLALRERCSALGELFGRGLLHGITARARHEAISAEGLMVSDNFFSGLGVRPFLGRLLGSEDEMTGDQQAVVISYRWWEQQFERDPNVVGAPVTLNGFNFNVVGVLPQGFVGMNPGAPEEFYVSFSVQPQLMPRESRTAPDRWWVPLMARLKPGVTDGQFQAVLDAVFAQGSELFMKQPRILVTSGRAGPDWGRRSYRGPLLLLLGLVSLVMIVACANLAGLLLARAAARRHEFALRASLGAARRRLIGQSLTESALIAFAGSGLGILIAFWGKTAIGRLITRSPDGLQYNTSFDLTVLGFTLAAALFTALLSGLLPALRASSVDPRAGLKDRTTTGAPQLRAGRTLVAGQIALAMILTVGAELYVRTLVNLKDVNPGFATENLLLFQLNPGNAGYHEPRTSTFYDQIQHSLASIPGVEATTLIRFPLLNGNGAGTTVLLPERASDRNLELESQTLVVGESFFNTMGIPIQFGRELRSSDLLGSLGVAVVNETFARRYAPGQNPVGMTMKAEGAEWRIVGICRDVKFANIKAEAPPTIYFSFRQKSTDSAWFALRTKMPSLALAAAARKAVASVDPGIPVTDLTTQEHVRDTAINQERLLATLCGSLAALAVLLSCNGLYGLMAYCVTRRTGEMGLRMALGATRQQIAALILRDAVVLTAAGATVGVPLAMAMAQVIRGRLYGVGPFDPVTLVLAILLFAGVALLAAWIPARRATKVDPMVALRIE